MRGGRCVDAYMSERTNFFEQQSLTAGKRCHAKDARGATMPCKQAATTAGTPMLWIWGRGPCPRHPAEHTQHTADQHSHPQALLQRRGNRGTQQLGLQGQQRPWADVATQPPLHHRTPAAEAAEPHELALPGRPHLCWQACVWAPPPRAQPRRHPRPRPRWALPPLRSAPPQHLCQVGVQGSAVWQENDAASRAATRTSNNSQLRKKQHGKLDACSRQGAGTTCEAGSPEVLVLETCQGRWSNSRPAMWRLRPQLCPPAWPRV